MPQRYDFPPFAFEVGPDPSDLPDSSDSADSSGPRRLRVLVFKDGQPFTDLHGAQMQKGFPATAGAARVEQFCRRFATDDAYRTQLLVKHAFACC